MVKPCVGREDATHQHVGAQRNSFQITKDLLREVTFQNLHKVKTQDGPLVGDGERDVDTVIADFDFFVNRAQRHVDRDLSVRGEIKVEGTMAALHFADLSI